MSDMSPEELFPPKPGGMVDTARKQAQAEAGQLAALGEAEAAPGRQRFDVPVADRAAELARARTFSVSTTGGNPVVELLGRDENRRNAVVMTLDEPVVISFASRPRRTRATRSTRPALANGFVLPVNVPVTVNARGVIYCTATSSTATRVSVMAFSYAES